MNGDIISVVGYEVSPQEVEAGLLLHPAIEEAAVIGLPDGLPWATSYLHGQEGSHYICWRCSSYCERRNY
jgi:acyl-CoA synthetase (AMP-forming)/AMP-acid ligase II